MRASIDLEHQLCPEEAPIFSRQFPLQTGLTRYSIDLRRRTRDRRNNTTIKKENQSQIEVHLKYIDTKPAIKKLSRVSKPSLRRYSGASDLKTVKNGLGIYVLSTNQGLLTDKQARSKNIGGEIICEVF